MSELTFQLVRATLRDLHESWLPHLDPGLVAKAKDNDFGRRWLASQLDHFTMFALPHNAFEMPDDLLNQNAWWRGSLANATELIIEIGALILSPRIRVTVTREQVLQWRRVLGPLIYRRCLESALPRANLNTMPESAPDVEIRDDAALAKILQKYGYSELLHFSLQQHELFMQRVSIAFPESWWHEFQDERRAPVLPAEVVAQVAAQWAQS